MNFPKSIKNKFIFIAILFIISSNILGQSKLLSLSFKSNELKVADDDSLNIVKMNERINHRYIPEWYKMFSNIPNNYVRVYDEYIQEKFMFTWVGIASSTILTLATDDYTYKISDKFNKQTKFNNAMSEFWKEFGDGRSQFFMAGAFALGGWIFNNDRALRTASQIVEVVLSAGSLIQILKHTTGRESPFLASSPTGIWVFFPNQIEYHKHVAKYDAFPSGHIATTIGTFIVIQENYPEYKWIEPVGWICASLVGIGMANVGIHWYSDYPLGLAIGYMFGKIVANPPEMDKNFNTEKNESNLKVLPYLNSYSFGMNLTYNF